MVAGDSPKRGPLVTALLLALIALGVAVLVWVLAKIAAIADRRRR